MIIQYLCVLGLLILYHVIGVLLVAYLVEKDAYADPEEDVWRILLWPLLLLGIARICYNSALLWILKFLRREL